MFAFLISNNIFPGWDSTTEVSITAGGEADISRGVRLHTPDTLRDAQWVSRWPVHSQKQAAKWALTHKTRMDPSQANTYQGGLQAEHDAHALQARNKFPSSEYHWHVREETWYRTGTVCSRSIWMRIVVAIRLLVKRRPVKKVPVGHYRKCFRHDHKCIVRVVRQLKPLAVH